MAKVQEPCLRKPKQLMHNHAASEGTANTTAILTMERGLMLGILGEGME